MKTTGKGMEHRQPIHGSTPRRDSQQRNRVVGPVTTRYWILPVTQTSLDVDCSLKFLDKHPASRYLDFSLVGSSAENEVWQLRLLNYRTVEKCMNNVFSCQGFSILLCRDIKRIQYPKTFIHMWVSSYQCQGYPPDVLKLTHQLWQSTFVDFAKSLFLDWPWRLLESLSLALIKKEI